MAFSVNWMIDGPNRSKIEPDGRIVSEYRRTYLYRTDAATPPTESQIVSDIGIVPGSPYINDANATCKSVEISHGIGPTKCPHFARYVQVEWSTNAPYPNTVSTNPTTMRTIWSVRPSMNERYIVQDRNGDMILNAAGQPFDGGVPTFAIIGTAVARKNFADGAFDVASMLGYSGYLNSTPFLGAAAKTVQVLIEGEEKYEGGYHFWALTFSFNYDPKGWQPKPMNAGFFRRIEPDSECLIRITNADLADACTDRSSIASPEAQVQEPEPLTITGDIVPIASRPLGCNFIEVDYWNTVNFNSFGL